MTKEFTVYIFPNGHNAEQVVLNVQNVCVDYQSSDQFAHPLLQLQLSAAQRAAQARKIAPLLHSENAEGLIWLKGIVGFRTYPA